MEIEKLREFSKIVASKYNLSLIVLFGSRANNTFRSDSDYDIAIYSKKKLSQDHYLEIYDLFFEKLNTNIDLVNLNEQDDPLLRNNIAKNSISLFELFEGEYDEFIVNSIFNYLDYEPLYKIEEEILNKKLENL